MAMRFDDDGFLRETLLPTVGGTIAASLASLVVQGAPAPAAALFGATVAAVFVRADTDLTRPVPLLLGGIAGLCGGAGLWTLTTRFGDGAAGAMVGGGLGGLALATWLARAAAPRHTRTPRWVGQAAATVVGALAALASTRLARGLDVVGTHAVVTAAVTGGLWAFWTTTANGVRRLHEVSDAELYRADELAARLTGRPLATLGDARAAYKDVLARLDETPAAFGGSTAVDVTETTQRLMAALCDAIETWHTLERELGRHDDDALQGKLRSVLLRRQTTTDDVTAAHLARAELALRAQHTSLHGLRVGRERSEAAAEVQLALLERLRLAVAHFEISDRERFSVELSEVSDQAARVSDELDSVSSILAGAESHEDRCVLAEAEACVRRALEQNGASSAATLALEPSEEALVRRS